MSDAFVLGVRGIGGLRVELRLAHPCCAIRELRADAYEACADCIGVIFLRSGCRVPEAV
jgi:hypothetical protein